MILYLENENKNKTSQKQEIKGWLDASAVKHICSIIMKAEIQNSASMQQTECLAHVYNLISDGCVCMHVEGDHLGLLVSSRAEQI